MGNRKLLIAICVGLLAVIALFIGGMTYLARPTAAQTPTAAPVPLTDIKYGSPYEIVRVEPFTLDVCPNGRAVSFWFADHNVRSQYICETDVWDNPTEIRRLRTVNQALTYSRVTFLRLEDPSLEGMRASNTVATRYKLELRRPLRPVPAPRPGRDARE